MSNTAMIPLTRGLFATVDAEDAEELSRHLWFANKSKHTSYAMRSVLIEGKRRNVAMHRILAGAGPMDVVDHRDGDGLNNRRSNLRLCTVAENNRNRTRGAKAKAGRRGIYRRETATGETWSAAVRTNGKQLYVGQFSTLAEAMEARDKATLVYHGEFAVLNAPLAIAPESFTPVLTRRKPVGDVTAWFWDRVRVADGCWEWTGVVDKWGCGQTGRHTPWNGIHVSTAHRLSWLITIGPLDADDRVVHTCLNCLCVRPEHLRVVRVRSRALAKLGAT